MPMRAHNTTSYADKYGSRQSKRHVTARDIIDFRRLAAAHFISRQMRSSLCQQLFTSQFCAEFYIPTHLDACVGMIFRQIFQLA